LSKGKSKAVRPATRTLFDFAAGAATLRANGGAITQEVQDCTNVMWSDLGSVSAYIAQRLKLRKMVLLNLLLCKVFLSLPHQVIPLIQERLLFL
jgi:hypothetical protein